MPPEIDWGEEKTDEQEAARPNPRMDAFEKVQAARQKREDEIRMEQRWTWRIKVFIWTPVFLAIIAGITITILDLLQIIHTGWYPWDPKAPPPPAPIQVKYVSEPVYIRPDPTPASPPVIIEQAPPPVVAEPVAAPVPDYDPVEIKKWSDKVQRVNHGIVMINNEINESSDTVRCGVASLPGLQGQLADAQNQRQAAAGYANNFAAVRQWDDTIQNLQAEINNTINRDNEETDHISSLRGRLDKAQTELSVDYAHYLAVGGPPAN